MKKSLGELDPTYDDGDEDGKHDEEELIIEYILNEMKENPYAYVGQGTDFMSFRKRRRVEEKIFDYSSTKWGKLISHADTRNPTSWRGKLFRRRFRVPFPLFEEVLLPLCREKNIFDEQRQGRIPLEIKLMAALRMLGRASCADSVSELSEIGESTAAYLFKKLVTNIAERVFPEVVKVPEGAYLDSILKVSAALGLPGMVGSMDVTHVRWVMCPKEFTQKCKGKEGYPTLAFQAIVSHDRMIWHVSTWNFGKNNDMTITRCDPIPTKIRRGLFRQIEFNMIDANGVVHLCKGCWILVDGGYMKDGVFINPMHDAYDMASVLWSEWMESDMF